MCKKKMEGKEHIYEMSLELDNLKSTCALLLSAYEPFVYEVDSCQRENTDTVKMIIYVVRMLAQSLA